MRDNPSFDPIERFLHDAENRLRRHLPERQMNEILDEARNHITQRAQEFTDSGAEPLQAREKAVQSFGNARSWSREIVHARYADANSGKFHRAAVSAWAVALVANTVWQLGLLINEKMSPDSVTRVSSTLLMIVLISVLVVFLASVRSKQSAPWLLAAMSLPVILTVFMTSGVTCILLADNKGPCDRSSLRAETAQSKEYLAQTQQDLRLLQFGSSVFHQASITPVAGIPSALRAAGGYIVPVPGRGYVGRTTSFRISPPQQLISHEWGPAAAILEEKQPYFTVPTLDEAISDWNENSSIYIWTDAAYVADNQADIQNLQQAQQRAFHSRFDYPAALFDAKSPATLLVIAIVANLFGAQLGRIIVRKKQLNRLLAA